MTGTEERARVTTAATAVLGCLGLLALVLLAHSTGDYAPVRPGGVVSDDAQPALHALLGLDLHRFARTQPALGLTSLLLRLPALAAARLAGLGRLGEYRLGALACLIPALVVSVTFARGLTRRGARPSLAAVAGVAVVVNPITFWAVQAGHPEEVLGAALVCAAVLAAPRRPLLAAALLGLAVGVKPWAVLAAPAVVLALAPGNRLRAGALAGGLSALLVLPGPLLSPAAYHASTSSITGGTFASPRSLWWAGGARHAIAGLPGVHSAILPFGLDRGGSLVVLLAAAALLVGAFLLRRPGAEDALGLLVLLMLLRLLLDPLALPYYGVPLVLALGVSAARRRGLGLAVMGAVAGLALAHSLQAPGAIFAVTLAWATPVALRALGPARPRAPRPAPLRAAVAR